MRICVPQRGAITGGRELAAGVDRGTVATRSVAG